MYYVSNSIVVLLLAGNKSPIAILLKYNAYCMYLYVAEVNSFSVHLGLAIGHCYEILYACMCLTPGYL